VKNLKLKEKSKNKTTPQPRKVTIGVSSVLRNYCLWKNGRDMLHVYLSIWRHWKDVMMSIHYYYLHTY